MPTPANGAGRADGWAEGWAAGERSLAHQRPRSSQYRPSVHSDAHCSPCGGGGGGGGGSGGGGVSGSAPGGTQG